jgi:hypothetical protein
MTATRLIVPSAMILLISAGIRREKGLEFIASRLHYESCYPRPNLRVAPMLSTMKHLWLEFRHPGYYAEIWRGMVEMDKVRLIYRIYRHQS